MKKAIMSMSAMTMLMVSAFGSTLGLNSSSITDGATQITSKPNLVFVFSNDIKSGIFVLKDSENKTIRLRKREVNNTVSLVPRRGLKDSQEYTLSMEVKDGSEVLIKTLRFTVGKGDTVAPVISSASNVTVEENQNDVMTIIASDVNRVIYALVQSRDASKFNLNANSGVLSLKDKADYEKKKKYVTKISTTDSKGNKTLQSITVRVTDQADETVTETPVVIDPVDENSPVFTSSSNININENQKRVFKVKASGTKVRYTLGGTDASSFNLNSKNGMLRFKKAPKFSTQSSYSITITAKDKDKNTSTQTINISIIKDGEAKEEIEEPTIDSTPPVFTSVKTVSVNENQKSVLTVKATDENEVSYSLSGIDSSSFNLDSNSGVLSFIVAPDYDTQSSYSVKVIATDSEGNSSSQNISISIKEVVDSEDEDDKDQLDTDGDGILDINDIDDDNDGVADSKDALPLDATDSVDTDGDGIGDIKDTDDDNDGVLDSNDAFPLISSESKDSDGDGIGDNADTNKDDGIKNNSAYAENFSREEYRQMLFESPKIDHNKHPVGGKYKQDFENEGWPETAHVLLRHIHANFQAGLFGSDSVSAEGMNYHFFWMAGMANLTDVLEGYQDPASWVPPTGIEKITEPLTHNEIIPPSERLDNYIKAGLMLTLPDGSDSGAHDTGLQVPDLNDLTSVSYWGAGGYHRGYGLEHKSISYLLPAFGQLGLGDGITGDPFKQTQSILHFSPKYTSYAKNGHAHSDSLMMGLYGKGRNLLSFPGHQNYSHGPHNKNMVSIGTDWQNYAESDLAGRLEVYAPLPGLQISRVDGSHITHGGIYTSGDIEMDKYRRTLIQNTVDIDKSYTLDIFEVKGGKEHNYILRGSGVHTQEYPKTNLSASNASLPYSDGKWEMFKDTKKVDYASNKSFWVDFLFSDDKKTGSRTHFPAQGESGTLYLNSLIDAYDNDKTHSHLMVYRKSDSSLESTFVTVNEVLDGSGNSFISSVTKNKINDGTAIAVTVTLTNGRIDTYLVSFDGTQQMSYNGIESTATIAASSSLGEKNDLWMVEGTAIDNGQRTLEKSYDSESSIVSRVYRKENGDLYNAFETPMNLAEGYTLSGQTLLLEHYEDDKLKFTNGHTIERVEKTENGSRIHLRFDPGVELTGLATKEVYFPGRTAKIAVLKFVPAETTIPRITHVSSGKEQWQRMHAQVGTAVETNSKISVTTVPANQEFNYIKTIDSSVSSSISAKSSITIPESMKVSFTMDNPQGLSTQRVLEEEYRTLLASKEGSSLSQGLNMHKYSGGNVNFDLNNNAWDGTGEGVNYYDLGRWSSTTVGALTSEYILDEGKDSSPSVIANRDRGALIDGYINIPTTGLYTFYSRLDGHSQIKIDDETIIEQAGMRRLPLWKGEVYLEKGLHKIFVHYFNSVHAGFSVMWKGPEIPYSEIPESILFQDIK